MTLNPIIAEAFARRKALKIISGLNNFDLQNVTAVCKAAEMGELHS